MWAKILGIIWILLGTLWLVKPEMLRKRLIKKSNRKMRWMVYGFIIVFVFSLLGMVFKAQWLWLKVGGIVGIFFAVKAVLGLVAKATGKVTGFWEDKPLTFFRIWGLVLLLCGVLLVLTR